MPVRKTILEAELKAALEALDTIARAAPDLEWAKSHAAGCARGIRACMECEPLTAPEPQAPQWDDAAGVYRYVTERRCDDAEVMRLWREAGLPESFLGNGGTNHKLVAFARLCAAAGLHDALRELDEACDAVAALRSQEIYLAMIDVPGTPDALLRLDRARQRARELYRA